MLSADIEKIFRQLKIEERHRYWQQIFGRENPEELIRTHQLTAVTYGMASGPLNAIWAMQQCAKDNHNIISETIRAATALDSILHDFYVDDYLSSVETTDHNWRITLVSYYNKVTFIFRQWLNCIGMHLAIFYTGIH